MKWNALFFIIHAFLAFGMLITPAAHAQQTQSEFDSLFDDAPKKAPRTITPEDYDRYIQEARDGYWLCEKDKEYQRSYDCRCVAGEIFNTRIDSGDFMGGSQKLFVASLETCKSPEKLANYYYQHCISWNASTRRDADEYCTCYGNSIGRNFARATFTSGHHTQQVVKNAMKECGFRKPYEEEKQRAKVLEEFNLRGILNNLFPSWGDDS